MTADYAESLKKAWDEMGCTQGCLHWHKPRVDCKGHAALLEMVDTYVQRPQTLRHERDLKEERRRLRAAVGIKEGD